VTLHSGERCELTLRPAPVDTGIVFFRVDMSPVVSIPAIPTNVGETMLSTCLKQGNVRVSTIEHLMSAAAGLGIDNLYVDLTAQELPIMDGSAAPFIFLLQSAGTVLLDAPKRFIRITQEINVQHEDKWARFTPYNGFKGDFTIDFNHPVLKEHASHATLEFSSLSYIKDISRARTYGFVAEIEQLREMGLAKGGSLDNAVAVDRYRILNEGGLRYDDEFVKHKLLDAMGDIYLLGPIIGAYAGYKSGHALNNKLCRELQAHPEAYEVVTFDNEDDAPFALIAEGGL
jgi:UDP-3-O-[3-hydroxymyristoyl] N-acetylglucosamine deacetylase